ncbi:hypothetical protein CUZ56_00240 [Saezia sanguinis]|uniref:Uncharacterized protein n=2 Tax=Saezia sanguinis TaxID=1965230 RepID=A0A433SG95_9BURK|nr:hypothetical protein CUZ56_00240 [Saezia sanguinis]
MIRIYPFFKPAACLFTMLLILFLSACQTSPPAITAKTDKSRPYLDAAPVQVVRYGRYTLVEVMPEQGQRDLMAQVIDVSFPLSQGMTDTTVGQAMRYVLQRSGYQMCDTLNTFDALLLPLVHAHLGPMQLRDALMVLAGPAWTLQVNETTRQVCFVSRFNNPNVKNEKTESV